MYDWEKPEYKLTCKDFKYTGVDCCESCHTAEWAEYELRVVKVDGVNALLCCAMVAFFYPRDPGKGMSPEEKLLMAIFGEKTVHPGAEKYIDPIINDPDYEPDF
jgi:hypothetical protein